MKKLYQSELYTKHHWKIVGTILFVLILVGGKFKGNIFLPHFVYFTLAAIKYLALPILLLLCDIHSDWVYSY